MRPRRIILLVAAVTVSIAGTAVILQSWRSRNAGQEEITFHVIQTPITDDTVRDAVKFVQAKIKEVNDVRDLPDRAMYIKEFMAVLRDCGQKDGDRSKPKPEVPPKYELTRRVVVARVIRTLGDLDAQEAAELLTEFLLLGPDTHVMVLRPHDGDMAAQWALFQIGDAALPFLRNKILSEHSFVSGDALNTALQILGPRRRRAQFERWIDDADDPMVKQRLAEKLPALRDKNWTPSSEEILSPEEYRQGILEKTKQHLNMVLKYEATRVDPATGPMGYPEEF